MIRLTLCAALLATATAAQTPPMLNDIVPAYAVARAEADYIRREVMIPMRDGVKLFTVIVMKKGTAGAPMLLTRTPYDAGKATSRNRSQSITEILPIMDAEFVNDGYIRVYQDVRGLHKSQGDYVMNRPLRGPLNATAVDHATDAYDTIDWLVKNVAESNGRVGITGSSYPGFTALMALIDPHPALKAAVPQSPMVDGWMGDDWFHNGAFRNPSFDYITSQTAKDGSGDVPFGGDDYDTYLKAGSAGDFARAYGVDAFPAARKLMEHPAYDAYWQEQALDKLLAKRKLTVPTMLVVGQWDQEDSYGAPAVYAALEGQDKANDMLHLVIGPWRHSGVNYEARSLGKLEFDGDTGLQFRRDTMKPFLDQHLKTGAPKAATPPVLTYASGDAKGGWQVARAWPMGTPTPLYLNGQRGLSFTPSGKAGADSYVSDPAKPVPFVPRPAQQRDSETWRTWLVGDQRFVADRSDVVSFTSAPLDKPVHIAGQPLVDLFAATSGTDSDWVVKLIDVYPDEATGKPKTAGMQLPVGIEIYRGRYVHGFSSPAALTPGKMENYKFGLPHVNHVFAPGHRIMVQVQSSLFPLYDRNPQSFVPNIFDAKAGDYKAATQAIGHGPGQASAVWLPVVP